MKTKILRLSITQADVDKYNKYYFIKHPRAHKKPIERPIHPSLNEWMIIRNRMVMNSLKQKWKDFAIFWCKLHKVDNLKLSDYSMEYIVYMPTKRRADPDNYTCKFLLDGFVEAGLIVDDDGSHMRALILRTRYDKDNPRTEINFRIYNGGVDNED